VCFRTRRPESIRSSTYFASNLPHSSSSLIHIPYQRSYLRSRLRPFIVVENRITADKRRLCGGSDSAFNFSNSFSETREVSLFDDLERGGSLCAIIGHNGKRFCTGSWAYVEPSIITMTSLGKLANNIRRVHSHGRIPPCVDDPYRSRNYLAMYVILDILWTMFHVVFVDIGMCTNDLQHSCWLDALHHPHKSPISSSYLCTMKSTSPFLTSRKSTPAW
jgi:hypothetical protein